MPIYEYACKHCGERHERLERMDAPSSHDCPACGAALGMERHLSAAAVAVGGGSAPAMPMGGGGCCSGGGCPFA